MRWGIWLLISVCVFLAGVLTAPHLHIDPRVGFAASFACIAMCVIGTGTYAPNLGARGLGIAALCAAGLFGIALVHGEVFFVTRAALVTGLLLCGGTLIGASVGGKVRDAGHLAPLGMVMSAADLFSVFHEAGPSAAVLASERALSVLAIPFALVGTHAIEPFLGVGDVIGAAIFLAATRAHGLPVGRTAAALAVGFALAVGAVLWTEAAIPVLPFLSASVLIAQPRARVVPAADRKAAGIAALALGGVLVLLVWKRLGG